MDDRELQSIMTAFEKHTKNTGQKRELRSYWKRGYYYQNGTVNDRFVMFMAGYMCARNVAILGGFDE